MVVALWLGRTDQIPHRSPNESRGTCQPRLRHSCLAEGDSVDPNHKMMVDGFVAAFAKAARVSDVPEEAITSDTRAQLYVPGG